jgi:hypothetical protein
MATAAAAAAATTARSSITRLLTTPRKVADILNWRRISGSILTLTISRDRLDLAVSWHPYLDEPLVQLPSVPLLETIVYKNIINNNCKNNNKASSCKKVLCSSVAHELDGICDRFSICGMVVHWPTQQDGWCGASCGRVLYTLDQLAAQSRALVDTRRLAVCLWDEQHLHPSEDEWGRAAVYGRQNTTSTNIDNNKTTHYASIEQYSGHRDAFTLDILWRDFCQAQWPELALSESMKSRHQHSKIKAKRKSSTTVNNSLSIPALSWLDSAKSGGQSSSPMFLHL